MDEQASFLPWFTDDPIAEAPLKVIIMLAERKNFLRLVSKLFKSRAGEASLRDDENQLERT